MEHPGALGFGSGQAAFNGGKPAINLEMDR